MSDTDIFLPADGAWCATSFHPAMGGRVRLARLAAGDGDRLAHFFATLAATDRRLAVRQALTPTRAHAICAAITDTADTVGDTLHLVATCERLDGEAVPAAEKAPIIGYGVVLLTIDDADRRRYAEAGILLDPATDATFQPIVPDCSLRPRPADFLLDAAVVWARGRGRRRLILGNGVDAGDVRTLNLYRRRGFRSAALFAVADGWTHGMGCALAS